MFDGRCAVNRRTTLAYRTEHVSFFFFLMCSHILLECVLRKNNVCVTKEKQRKQRKNKETKEKQGACENQMLSTGSGVITIDMDCT